MGAVRRGRLNRLSHEAGGVLRRELHPQAGAERIEPEAPEIFVEVPQAPASTMASIPAAFARSTRLSRAVACRVVVAQYIESAQRLGEQDGGQMGCG